MTSDRSSSRTIERARFGRGLRGVAGGLKLVPAGCPLIVLAVHVAPRAASRSARNGRRRRGLVGAAQAFRDRGSERAAPDSIRMVSPVTPPAGAAYAS